MRINILLCVVISAINILPTVILNLLIIVITSRNQYENTTTRTLLINLVLVDLLMGSFAGPFRVVEFTMIYRGKDPCFLTTITAPISFTFGAISFLTLAALAIDSFMLFCYPFWHQTLQKRDVVAFVLTTIWMTPLYPMVNSAIVKSMKVVDIFIMVTGTIIIMVNVFCYGMIYRLIRRHRNQIRVSETRLGTSSRSKKNKNLIICAIMLLTAMIFCYLPIMILSNIRLVTKHSNKRLIGYFTYWAWTLTSLNSLLNPILKFYRLASIREAFKRFWATRVLRNDEGVLKTTTQH